MIRSVTLCMVTYNEGHRIYDTLMLAGPYVNEVVVVDQMSSDNTINAIAGFAFDSEIPTIIVPDKHWGYCEPSRQKAHDYANGDWILVLDADESISPDFARDMRTLDEKGFMGSRLKRSLWISGEHRFTGDYQYRYFRRDAATYLSEIHTEPQPTVTDQQIFYGDYVGITHEKSWTEQVRDEQAYDQILAQGRTPHIEAKKALNVYSKLLEEAGIKAIEADVMTQEEKDAAGIGAPDWARI